MIRRIPWARLVHGNWFSGLLSDSETVEPMVVKLRQYRHLHPAEFTEMVQILALVLT
jgi:hypothetical protein